MSPGWVGRLLRVDLTSGRVSQDETAPLAGYVGGTGIAARIYLDEAPRGVDPFAPENPLIVMTGPLAGTPALSSGRVTFYSKSPLGYPLPMCRPSSMGGWLGAELKYAGLDGVIVDGASERPVYLWIEDGTAEIRDAADLWGLDTFETQRTLLARHDRQASVAAIGPSGENLGRMAAIVHGTGFASGLSGFGAVMGSKKLKAIGVRGTGGVEVAEPRRLLDVVAKATRLVYDAADPPRMTGMRGLGWEYPGGDEFIARHSVGLLACHACPVACQGVFKVPGTPLGADCCVWPHPMLVGFTQGVEGWRGVWDVNSLVNRLGLSAYEVGQAFQFVCRLRGEGVLTEDESGLPLHGDPHELAKALAYQIAYRQGLGEVLAEALPRAAERIGHDAARLVVDARGWPILTPPEDPRLNATKALLPLAGVHFPYNDGWSLWAYWGGTANLTVSDSREELGPDEIRTVTRRVLGDENATEAGTFDGKAGAVWRAQVYRMLADSLPFCTWVLPIDAGFYDDELEGDPSVVAGLYSAVTGIETGQEEVMRLGERIATLERLVGLTQGYHSRECDLRALNERLFREPLDESPLPGGVLDEARITAELERYYELLGWDAATGLPDAACLRRLGMDDVVDIVALG